MEQFGPIAKCFIRCDNRAAFLVSIRNKSEKQVALIPGYRCIAYFINNNQGRSLVTRFSSKANNHLIIIELFLPIEGKFGQGKKWLSVERYPSQTTESLRRMDQLYLSPNESDGSAEDKGGNPAIFCVFTYHFFFAFPW